MGGFTYTTTKCINTLVHTRTHALTHPSAHTHPHPHPPTPPTHTHSHIHMNRYLEMVSDGTRIRRTHQPLTCLKTDRETRELNKKGIYKRNQYLENIPPKCGTPLNFGGLTKKKKKNPLPFYVWFSFRCCFQCLAQLPPPALLPFCCRKITLK